jgi:hypothetical protein
MRRQLYTCCQYSYICLTPLLPPQPISNITRSLHTLSNIYLNMYSVFIYVVCKDYIYM